MALSRFTALDCLHGVAFIANGFVVRLCLRLLVLAAPPPVSSPVSSAAPPASVPTPVRFLEKQSVASHPSPSPQSTQSSLSSLPSTAIPGPTSMLREAAIDASAAVSEDHVVHPSVKNFMSYNPNDFNEDTFLQYNH